MHIAFVDPTPAALAAIPAAKQAGHQVTFIESDKPVYARTPANRAAIALADDLVTGVRTMDPDAVLAALGRCHTEHAIDVVSTQNEMAARAVAIACRRLGLRGTAPDAVLTARRKDLCRAALRAAGLAHAGFALASDEAGVLAAAAQIGYPVVLKPPAGTDSLLTFVAHDADEARAACHEVLAGLDQVPPAWREQFSEGILVEELLTGRLVSAEIGARDGAFFPFCVSGRIRWCEDEVVELGAYIPALPEAQARRCFVYAAEVCRAIGLDLGIFHLEIMLTGRGPVLVEANPRVMGGAMPTIYRMATGADIYTALVQILTGAPDVRLPATFDGCTGGHKVAVSRAGRIGDHAALSFLEAHPSVLEVFGFADFHTGPGQRVRRGQTVARFILREADHRSVVATAGQILRQLERDLGVSLMIGEKPDPAGPSGLRGAGQETGAALSRTGR
ncbi:MAG TPA: ATP-grasp domain-containing protein [Streptosporangiaceae bacterium]|jgi:biotin carboxylase